MSISATFIRRPIGTSLLTAAILLVGGVSYFFLPKAPIPQIDFPTISVHGSLPGASPETMASAVPLSAFTHFERKTSALQVNHQGQFPAVTISFNLGEGVALGDAVNEIEAGTVRMGLPSDIHATFQGTAKAFESSLATEPWLILAAVITVYLVLGILYESYIHPLTILSTLPSAGVGAL